MKDHHDYIPVNAFLFRFAKFLKIEKKRKKN